MKRKILMFLSLIIVILLASGCGGEKASEISDNSLTGKWEIDYNNLSEQYQNMLSNLDLKEDGTYVWVYNDLQNPDDLKTITGTYTSDNQTITLSDIQTTFNFSGDKITYGDGVRLVKTNGNFTKTAMKTTSSDKDQAVVPNQDAESYFKSTCLSIPFEELARFPDNHKNQPIVITGKIVQVITKDNGGEYRLVIDGDYNQVFYINYFGSFKQGNILNNDTITFWGTYDGTTSYESTLGAKITVPSLMAKYYAIK